MSRQDLAGFAQGSIDKDSPIPYHYQLREIIRNEISASRWEVNDQLPSEKDFCEAFNVSRTTVREALDALVTEGLIRREKGVGTFIADPKFKERWSGAVIGFSDSLTEQGYMVETEVLALQVIAPSAQVRQELQLYADDNVIHLKRLRYIMQKPILIVDSYLPEKMFDGLTEVDFTQQSLYKTLRTRFNTEITRVKRLIEAVSADEELAAMLQTDLGFPLMYIASTAYNSVDTPIEYFTAWRRGDRTTFEFEYEIEGKE